MLAPTPIEVHEAQFVLPQLAPQQRGSAPTTLQLVFQGASSSGNKPICLPASSKAQVPTGSHAIVCWYNSHGSCLGHDSRTLLQLNSWRIKEAECWRKSVIAVVATVGVAGLPPDDSRYRC